MGAFELGFFRCDDEGNATLTRDQIDTIRNHLNLVFVHDIDPKAGGPEQQAKLNEIHSPLDVVQPGSLGPVRPDMNSHMKRPQSPFGPIMRC